MTLEKHIKKSDEVAKRADMRLLHSELTKINLDMTEDDFINEYKKAFGCFMDFNNPATVLKQNEAMRVMMDALKLEFDCGDNSCRFAKKKAGMRTNGGCRCICDNGPKIAIHLFKQKEGLAKEEEIFKE